MYQISCDSCTSKGIKSHYLGETHRTIFDRMAEHFSKYQSRHKDSAMVKHWKNFHGEEQAPSFSVKVVSKHRSATERQISEALLIEDGVFDNLLNSKTEWGGNRIPRQKTTIQDEVWNSSSQIPGMAPRLGTKLA